MIKIDNKIYFTQETDEVDSLDSDHDPTFLPFRSSSGCLEAVAVFENVQKSWIQVLWPILTLRYSSKYIDRMKRDGEMERTQPETRKTPLTHKRWVFYGVTGRVARLDESGRIGLEGPVCTVHIRYSTYYIKIIDIILLQGTARKRTCPDLPPT